METAQRTLHVERAAEILGISRATAYRAASRGELPAIRVGKRLLILKDRFEQLLAGDSPQTLKPTAQS